MLFQFFQTVHFKNLKSSLKTIQEGLVLQALAHCKLKNTAKAIELFEIFLQNPSRNLTLYYDEAWFELGLAYFTQQQLEQAKQAFKQVEPDLKKINIMH